jgi:hypothetical protein
VGEVDRKAGMVARFIVRVGQLSGVWVLSGGVTGEGPHLCGGEGPKGVMLPLKGWATRLCITNACRDI